jgi:hypothetical protein
MHLAPREDEGRARRCLSGQREALPTVPQHRLPFEEHGATLRVADSLRPNWVFSAINRALSLAKSPGLLPSGFSSRLTRAGPASRIALPIRHHPVCTKLSRQVYMLRTKSKIHDHLVSPSVHWQAFSKRNSLQEISHARSLSLDRKRAVASRIAAGMIRAANQNRVGITLLQSLKGSQVLTESLLWLPKGPPCSILVRPRIFFAIPIPHLASAAFGFAANHFSAAGISLSLQSAADCNPPHTMKQSKLPALNEGRCDKIPDARLFREPCYYWDTASFAKKSAASTLPPKDKALEASFDSKRSLSGQPVARSPTRNLPKKNIAALTPNSISIFESR